MVHIEILLFVLGSFFGLEDARIAAEKTNVSLFPETQEVEIIHEGMIAMIQSDEDVALALEQWENLLYWEEKEMTWTDDLNVFPVKTLTFTLSDTSMQSKLKFRYSDETDLQALGIGYNLETHQFFIEHTPQMNLKTNDGFLEGSYWVFDADNKFSYSLNPFKDMPKEMQKNIQSIKDLLDEE